MNISIFLKRALLFATLLILVLRTNAQQLKDLKKDQVVHGFSTKAIYLNDAGQPMGGRFIHQRTGFTFDLLQIESVPQTFIYANTHPVSDMGEPHTQEHLLITKGSKGIGVNTREGMSIAVSNAFTHQLFTAYHFYTGAGTAVYHKLFEGYMDALLHPDYTEEEVKREVMNWGVSEVPGKGLRIEEKGAVYNEMYNTMNNRYSELYDKSGRLLYGDAHPLAYNAGGLPSGIRKMKPSDIENFHKAYYHLWNMGAITSLPKSESLSKTLSETDKILNRLEPNSSKPGKWELATFKPAPEGQIELVSYPSKTDQETGNYLVVYPANRELNPLDELMLSNFMQAMAGSATSNLYKKFVDSKTRETDLGAQAIYSYVEDYQGQAVFIGIDDVDPASITKEKAALVSSMIVDEFRKVANYADGSPELIEFNNRFKNNLVDFQRFLTKFINTPPKFGFRNTNSAWYFHLQELNKEAGFEKHVLFTPQFSEAEKMLASGKNIWKPLLQKWKLLDSKPYVIITKASSKLMEEHESQKLKRAEEEVNILKSKYAVNDEQAAIKKYKEEYDANSAVLDKAKKALNSRFLDNPPLTMDDELDFRESIIANKVKMHSSYFNNMTSSTIGIAIDLKETKPSQLVYLGLLPQLLRETGVIKDGKQISYEDMSEAIKKEILSFQSTTSSNVANGRTELLMKAAGNNIEESKKAIGWMKLVLTSPNWTKENLPRLNDLVNQNLSALRKTMQNPEETWVSNPANSYKRENDLVYLSATSILTRIHHVLKLKWMLKEVSDPSRKQAFIGYLRQLGSMPGSREEKLAKLQFLRNDSVKMTYDTPPKLDLNEVKRIEKDLLREAVTDIELTMTGIPDESLQQDWYYLWNMMADGLEKGPALTLTELNELRKQMLKKENLRLFTISSERNLGILMPDLTSLLSIFNDQAVLPVNNTKTTGIRARIAGRTNSKDVPVYVGLMNPNTTTGVFMNWAKLTSLDQTDKESLLRYLAAGLYGGGGPQSVFSITTGAGLSYSTGVGINPNSGIVSYYAERTPELPQTLSFVIAELKKAPRDNGMGEYVIANAFRNVRSANDYESRGEAMANDYVDGLTPDKVRKFRTALLNIRKMPNLVDELYKRKDMVYEKILPGYGVKGAAVRDAQFFVIGNEKQMAAYDAYLKKVEGTDTQLVRIYPRDYWITE